MKSLLLFIFVGTTLFCMNDTRYSTHLPLSADNNHDIRSFIEAHSLPINALCWGLIATYLNHKPGQSVMKHFMAGYVVAYILLLLFDVTLAGFHALLDAPFTLSGNEYLLADYPMLTRTLFWGTLFGLFIHRNKARPNYQNQMNSFLAATRPMPTSPEQQALDFLLRKNTHLVTDALVVGPITVLFPLVLIEACAFFAHCPATILQSLF